MNIIKEDFPERMRAALVTRYGGPEVIEITEVPLPVLKPGMIMIRVETSAVNSADVRTRSLNVSYTMMCDS